MERSLPVGVGKERPPAGRVFPPAALTIPAVLAAVLVLLPIGYVGWQGLHVPAAQAVKLLVRPLIGQLLLNTIGLVLSATACCAMLGTAAAWLIERTRFPGRGIYAALMVVPLAIPSFITSYAWVSMSRVFEGYWGALLVVTASYMPLVYLPVAAALRGMDPALDEVARSLGVSPVSRLLRVTLPQLRVPLLGGMLLVALNVLVEFGAFALLRYRTFTTEIFAEYRTGFNGPQASLLALVLLALCLLCLAIEFKVRGRAHYAKVDRGTRRVAELAVLGRSGVAVSGALALYLAATIAVPFGMVAFWMTRHNAAAVSPVMASSHAVFSATMSSLTFGAYGVVITLGLAVPIAFLATRYDGRLVTLLERVTYLAQGIPGIVIALAMIAMTVRTLPLVYQSTLLLEVVYAILFLPLAVVSLRATFAQLQKRLEEAGRSLGLSPWAVARRVVLPLAGPGVGAAAAIVFVSVTTELTATLLLAPIGTETLATEIWADTTSMAFASAAPYAALMAIMSLVAASVLAGRFGHIGGPRPQPAP